MNLNNNIELFQEIIWFLFVLIEKIMCCAINASAVEWTSAEENTGCAGMKHSFIKYEKLSSEIKQEISKYHNSVIADTSEAVFDESMAEWFENRFDEWLLNRYSSGDQQGRRKFFRLEVEIPIRIIDTLIESSRDDKHAMEFIGKIVNISRGGLYFKSDNPIEISSIIKVIIDFSGVDKDLNEVEALAMVIRCDKLPEDDYGIGIMFSSIYEANKERLDLFILKNLSYYIYSE